MKDCFDFVSKRDYDGPMSRRPSAKNPSRAPGANPEAAEAPSKAVVNPVAVADAMPSASAPGTPIALATDAPTSPGGQGRGLGPALQSALIVGVFALISAAALVAAWPGYRLRRNTQAAEAALAAHNSAAALAPLREIVKMYPAAWSRQAQLGDCLLDLERPQEALDAYAESLKGNAKQNFDAQMGQAFYLLRQEDKAIEKLSRAIKTNPYDAKANYYIGLYHMNRKDYARAAFFLQGAASDPKLFEKAKPQLERVRTEILGG